MAIWSGSPGNSATEAGHFSRRLRVEKRIRPGPKDPPGTYGPLFSVPARGRVGGMSYEIYVDGRYAASFASGWDEAATWIEKHTANRTPLRRLAELGETHHPGEAAAMLSDLLEHQKPAPDIAHTLRHIHQFLTGDHVFIWDGVDEEG